MKKFLLLIFVLSFILSGCGNDFDMPLKTIEPSQTENIAPKNPDVINNNNYAGKLVELTDAELTILMGGTDKETFTLNERAKRDIDILNIKLDDRIIVEFDPDNNRNILSVQKIRSEV